MYAYAPVVFRILMWICEVVELVTLIWVFTVEQAK